MKLEISQNSDKENKESQSENNSASANCKKSQKIFGNNLEIKFGNQKGDLMKIVRKII